MRKIKYSILVILLISAFLVFESSQSIEAALSNQQVPISFAASELYTDNDLGFSARFPDGYLEEDRAEKNLNKVIYYKSIKDGKVNSGIKIVSFAGENSSALSQLERYIITNVGSLEKLDQKVEIHGSTEIAQIMYNPFNADDESYYSIYTLIKKGERSWLVGIGYYTDLSTKDTLNNFSSENLRNYKKFLEEFNTIDKYSKQKVSRLLEPNDSNQIRDYKNNNRKFVTTFK